MEHIEAAPLTRYAWISLAAAALTIALKAAAYLLTGSVGLLSDAMESFINLVGALMALWMLSVAAAPDDEEHAFGHGKAEYFSSGVEGTLILLAAISIAIAAVNRLMHPRPLEQVGMGLMVSVAASIINLMAAIAIGRAGRRHNSITLEANSAHLMTDVWTSAGVLAGVGMVAITGWMWLDPVVALLVAGNIVWTGVKIVRQSVSGLMDTALPEEEIAIIKGKLDAHLKDGGTYHALRTRRAGANRFVTVHVLVPGDWSVQKGHSLIEELEDDLCAALPNLSVTTHLEPVEDQLSWNDGSLHRKPSSCGKADQTDSR